MANTQILVGDCRATLKTLPDRSVHLVVTSPLCVIDGANPHPSLPLFWT